MNPIELYALQYPDLSETRLLELIAQEAFIRRVASLDFPFMLKGSHVTRQYFPNLQMRLPADLDYVMLPYKEDCRVAENSLNKWAEAVTTAYAYDGVTFTPFSQNPFWRNVDYAMSEDFPTTNTDLTCTINGQRVELSVDVSFNLDLPIEPDYYTVFNTAMDQFTLPYSVPLAPQIAWKLHQTLVRPRFKDLYDLSYLVQHIQGDANLIEQILEILAAECRRDQIPLRNIRHLFSGNLHDIFCHYDAHSPHVKNLRKDWNQQRKIDEFSYICPQIPDDYQTVFEQYVQSLREAGLTLDNLVLPQ